MPTRHRPISCVLFAALAALAACATSAPLREDVAPAPLALASSHEKALPNTDPAGDRRAFFGLGFTGSPGAMLFGGEVDIPVTPSITVGPMLQFATDSNTTLIAPSVQAKYFLPLDEGPVPLMPFVQAGAGLMYLDQSSNLGGQNDGIGLLVHLGVGAEYRVRPGTTIGTSLYYDLLPDEVAGENAVFGWQLLQIAFFF